MKAFDSTVTVERVKGLLSYNPDTGIFTWRVDRNPWHLKGMVAGGVSTFGHMTISVDKKRLMAHRVAWAITHGDWPKTDIDHINGDPADNRMLNLRMVTRGHNLQNQKKAHHDSKSGLLGVEVRVGKRKTYWIAKIFAEGVLHRLGAFSSAEEASAAYVKAKRRLHPGCTI